MIQTPPHALRYEYQYGVRVSTYYIWRQGDDHWFSTGTVAVACDSQDKAIEAAKQSIRNQN